MRSTNRTGRHAPVVGHDSRPASAPAERATRPPADLAADWLIRRYRVRPSLALTVAGLAGLGERSARA
jgi:hypothetical protein